MSKQIAKWMRVAGVVACIGWLAPAVAAPSSFNDEAAQWQQFKAKQGISELDAEMEKLEPSRKPAPTPAPVVVIVPVAVPVAIPAPTPVPTIKPQPLPVPVIAPKPAPVPVPVIGDNMREIIDCSDICPQMVAIPPGKFLRGSPESEEGRRANEGPQQEVTIGYWLAVSRIQVTRGEWNRCVAEEKCPGKGSDYDQRRELLPAYNISWDQAQQYIAWLNKKTKQNYRLLTEAEWEYVVRAGTTTAYWWGEEFDKSKVKPFREEYQPIGYNPANPWGLYDMVGRQSEWVQDCYHDSFVYNPTFKLTAPPFDGSAWEKNADCNIRVLRGRPTSDRVGMRSAYRFGDRKGDGGGYGSSYGFRIAKTLKPSELAGQ